MNDDYKKLKGGTLLKDVGNEEVNDVRGRVIGLVEEKGLLNEQRGFVLQDDSARKFISTENLDNPEQLPRVGDIVTLWIDADFVALESVKIVTPCVADFYISSSSPNYKKIVVDLYLKEQLIKRTKIIQWIREYFFAQNYIETDTPELVRLPGMEPYLDVFQTEFKPLFENEFQKRQRMYLITSPEYAMKKLLVGGFEKIFQITKAFRNKETGGATHNPEFTILEFYQAFADYNNSMTELQHLIMFLFEKLHDDGQQFLQWGDAKVDMYADWRRLKVVDAFEEYAGISREVFEDLEKFRAAVKAKGYNVDETSSFDDMFFLVFLNEIEGKLGHEVPTFLCDYPVSMAALSRKCKENPLYAERFELYITGLELCNGFTELNDPVEQLARLKLEREERIKLGKEIYDVDQSFIEALELGMPPCAGPAVGVDRLIMLLLGAKNIEDVLFFPYKDL